MAKPVVLVDDDDDDFIYFNDAVLKEDAPTEEESEDEDEFVPFAVAVAGSVPPAVVEPEALRAVVEDAGKVFGDFLDCSLSLEKQGFIVQYMTCGTLTGAYRSTGITPFRFKSWKDEDEEFRLYVEAAADAIADGLEAEALRRAMNGSDKLLETMLKAVKPEKYATRKMEKVDKNVNVAVGSWSELAKRSEAELVHADVRELPEPEDIAAVARDCTVGDEVRGEISE